MNLYQDNKPMDRPTAERLIAAALALDPPFGKIDQVISQMSDGTERRAYIHALGDLLRLQNDGFILPVTKKYPDLAPAD